jgi:hypothetical protein
LQQRILPAQHRLSPHRISSSSRLLWALGYPSCSDSATECVYERRGGAKATDLMWAASRRRWTRRSVTYFEQQWDSLLSSCFASLKRRSRSEAPWSMEQVQ